MSTASHGGNGRAGRGRFAAGNTFGRGSPVARKMHEFRLALLEAGSVEQLQALFRKLAELGLAGDVPAARLYLEYCCGKPPQDVTFELGADDSGTDRRPIVVEIRRPSAPEPD